MNSIPGPRVPSTFIDNLLVAFHRRRKAIKYKLGRFEPTFGVEEASESDDLKTVEFLHVEAATRGRPATQISLRIWEDGEIWFRLCRPGPSRHGGWVFNETFRGSTADLSGRKLVEFYEESLIGLHNPLNGGKLRERILKIWEGHLQ